MVVARDPAAALATMDHTDFAHTGPGTLAGRYLRRFWQPVLRAEDLPAGHAKPIRIMSEDFTLYRGEDGAPHVVAFRCAHRGTQLSTGWVEGDCIRCFYHGWKYDASGQCVEMPAEDPSFPPKVRIKSYPTEEYLGLIFAYLGDDAPPPLPRYPEFEEPGVLTVQVYTMPCNYFNNLDNGPDEVHVCFVHRDTALGAIAEVPRITAEETPYGLVQYGTRSDGVVRVTPFLMPNILYFTTPAADPAFGWLDALGWRVPVDDGHHTGFRVYLARVTGELAECYRADQARRRERAAAFGPTSKVAEAVLAGRLRIQDVGARPDLVQVQDYVAQCGQGVIADRAHERLGRSDVGVILLRRIWARELEALATGQPLKQWRRPARLAATSGV
ncbi:MAG TPA: Rieske 2Fe-2S domain-containing protein [Chloroflexota bacterium]|nr:Rieske 2Fe-2S domain-containing protein [Chloroflexota bacterium]